MSWCLISGQLYRASWILKILHSLSSCFLVPFAAVDFYVKRSQLWMDLSCLWVLGWLSTGLLSNKTEGIFSFRFRHQYRNISADHKIQISPIAFAWPPMDPRQCRSWPFCIFVSLQHLEPASQCIILGSAWHCKERPSYLWRRLSAGDYTSANTCASFPAPPG